MTPTSQTHAIERERKEEMTAREICKRVALAAFAVAAGQALGITGLGSWWWWSSISLGLFFWALAEVL